MDDDFSDLFSDLDAPTESARPARASKLDRVEIEDSEGLRAIVEAELETELFETDDFGTTVEGEIVISYDAASGQDVIDAARRANRSAMSSLRSDDPDWTSRFDAIVAESCRIARLEDLRVGILQLRATAETVESERDSAETIECYDGDHVLTDVGEIPFYGIQLGDTVKADEDKFTVTRIQGFEHGHRMTLRHWSGNECKTTSVEAYRVVR